MRNGNRRFIAVVVVLALAAGWRGAHHFLRPHLLHTGDRLSGITVATLEGGTVTLRPPGRPEIINVFATWCPPCRMEMPALAAAARDLQRDGIAVVGIDQQESAAAVSRFQDEFSVGYPLYIDTSNVTHAVLGARMIPQTIYVDSRGVIRWMHEGPLDAAALHSLARTHGQEL